MVKVKVRSILSHNSMIMGMYLLDILSQLPPTTLQAMTNALTRDSCHCQMNWVKAVHIC